MWNFIRKEPVVVAATVLILVMVVQKVWLGEVITRDYVEWAISLFATITGATFLRKKVTPTQKINDSLVKDHNA